MSLTRFKTQIVGTILALILANSATAQNMDSAQTFQAPEPNVSHPGLFTPFMDPGYFHPDFQFFAPVDVDEYGGEYRANTGWFGKYDRMYVWVTRARQEVNPTNVDHTWGTRFDFGFMTEEQHGWLFNIVNVNGPNANQSLLVERLNQLDTTNPVGSNTNPPVFPISQQNDPTTLERSYTVRNSLNNARLNSFEANKIFRLDPSHNGTFLEPFAGVRYMRFADFTTRQTYGRFDTNGVPLGALPPNDPNTAVFEQYSANNTQILNDMFGGQLGFRVHKRASRWNISGEFRAFAMQNFQSLQQQTNIATTEYAAIGVGNIPTQNTYSQTYGGARATQFVVGGEVRTNAAFQLTRSFSLNMGAVFFDLGRGVGRGQDLVFNSQSVQIAGLTFGCDVNW